MQIRSPAGWVERSETHQDFHKRGDGFRRALPIQQSELPDASSSEIRGRARPRFFSFNRERCLTFHVLPAETEFREERDSHRSEAGGVTPACLDLLLQNGKPDDAPENPLAKQS